MVMNFIVQWFTDNLQGICVNHKSFTDQERAKAFAKALTLKDIQTIPEFDFTSEWVKVYGGQRIEKTPVAGEAWEKWQEENPNFYWSSSDNCFKLKQFPAFGISLYEGELF